MVIYFLNQLFKSFWLTKTFLNKHLEKIQTMYGKHACIPWYVSLPRFNAYKVDEVKKALKNVLK